MLQSLANSLGREVKTNYHITSQPQGNAESGWIVLDYGDVVVHLFSTEQRDYYLLEDLWSDGSILLRLM